MDQIYVYGDIEVRLTGRKATKTVKDGTRRRVKTTYAPIKYEITPTEEATTWTRWVTMEELYEIDNSNIENILEDISTTNDGDE